ncbi:PEPxxWA-CTERM sorting domain-containing protein [[Empedobacter] haloabium]|uniref:PEPxxWA-CTERM sorting domain-containing protein n=1 Tax=[Empedobacter] haloabium TaxID=592317 RepID=A0ABZ1URU9_9BURK
MTALPARFAPLIFISCVLALPAAAAPAPEQRKQRTCSETMQEHAQAGAQRRQADLDGRGVCALQDGAIRQASRGNGGGTPGDADGATADEGLAHRFADTADTHRLRSGGRVVTVDLSQDMQRSGAGGWGHRYGEDLFSQQIPFEPIAGPLGNAVPGYGMETVHGLAAGQFTLRSVMAGIEGAANPGLAGGALTSRAGGRMSADDADATTPVPEPATWAMLLGGFALLAARARRQRR